MTVYGRSVRPLEPKSGSVVVNTLVVVQVGQSQIAHGGMLYDTTPNGCGFSKLSEFADDIGRFAGFDGSTSSISGVDSSVGFAGRCAKSGDSTSEAEATGKHSVNVDVI